jgi:hypothetical protein
MEQQTEELLNYYATHPMLTGKCPSYGAEIECDYRAVAHWDC